MELSCVRQDQIPGTSKLFADFLYNFERVSSFYPHNFAHPDSFSRTAEGLAYPETRRAQLVAALREQNGDSPALDSLAEPGTVAVVTGQQVGLLSGPSYTIFKAATAVKLARELSQNGIKAVPVFWLASEDHDLAEIDHAWLFNQDVKPTQITVAHSVVGGGPVGDVKIPAMPWQEVAEALGELPFADETIERLKRAYTPEATFGSGFKAFLQDVLKDFGLLFLDPLNQPIRELARPFLSETVARVPELLEALKVRDRELETAGYHSQVHLDNTSSLLFVLEKNKRSPLRWKDGQFTSRDRNYSTEELQSIADRLSPNALLRPVMQDFLLPTISYVGGPAEIAYMAQSQVLYDKLLGRMPVIFPRNSFTLLDVRAEKMVNRYALSMPDLLNPQDRVRSKIAAQLVPPGLAGEFSVFESIMAKAVASLQSNLHRFDPSLEAAAKKSGAKMQYQLKRLSDKTARETLRRDERSVWAANYLMDLVYPQRHLQERFYSIVPFLAKYGTDLPGQILDMAQLTCPDHMVRTL